MSELITALREEIRKQARKEVRAALEKTKKQVANHRREIARLKKLLGEATKRIDFLEGRERARIAQAEKQPKPDVSLRFSAKSLRNHRDRIGFSARDYGMLLGVSAQTIYQWERGKTRPGKQQLVAIAALRGVGKKDARERLRLLSVED